MVPHSPSLSLGSTDEDSPGDAGWLPEIYPRLRSISSVRGSTAWLESPAGGRIDFISEARLRSS